MERDPGPIAKPPGIPRRQKLVGLGLLLTFLGLFLVVLLFPTSPGLLERTIPVVGGGLFFLWLGGVLMGQGMGSGSRAPRGGGRR